MRDFMWNQDCSGCFVTPENHTLWCKVWRLYRRLMREMNELWESMTDYERDESNHLFTEEFGDDG